MSIPVAEMRAPTYFVLASLLDGPLHGYAIIKRAEELSGGRVRMATGTLYTALDRLAAEGYIRPVSEEIVERPGAPLLRADRARRGRAARRGGPDGRRGRHRHQPVPSAALRSARPAAASPGVSPA